MTIAVRGRLPALGPSPGATPGATPGAEKAFPSRTVPQGSHLSKPTSRLVVPERIFGA